MTEIEKALSEFILKTIRDNNIQTQRIFQVIPDTEKNDVWMYRKESDTEPRCSLSQNLDADGTNENSFATFKTGNGSSAPWHSYGFVYDPSEDMCIFELNSRNKRGDKGNPLAISLNNRNGTTMVMAAKDGDIQVRNQYEGSTPKVEIVKKIDEINRRLSKLEGN